MINTLHTVIFKVVIQIARYRHEKHDQTMKVPTVPFDELTEICSLIIFVCIYILIYILSF